MSIRVNAVSAQFENVNTLRSYPFADAEGLMSKDGRRLPDDIISDMHIVVPTGALDGPVGGKIDNAPLARLASVHISSSMVSACVKVDYGGSVCALSVMVAKDGFLPYYPYRMEKLSGASDVGGVISFGNIDFSGGPETYFFDGATLHSCCVSLVKPVGLRCIVDPRSGERLAGDVDFEFTAHINAEKNSNGFVLSVSSESETELMSQCESALGDNPCGATPIASINGVAPDEDGNIVLWFH